MHFPITRAHKDSSDAAGACGHFMQFDHCSHCDIGLTVIFSIIMISIHIEDDALNINYMITDNG